MTLVNGAGLGIWGRVVGRGRDKSRGVWGRGMAMGGGMARGMGYGCG